MCELTQPENASVLQSIHLQEKKTISDLEKWIFQIQGATQFLLEWLEIRVRE